MTVRILKPRAQPTGNPSPKTPHEWDALMRKVMARAAQVQDRRLQGLQGVISRGETAKFLKKMGIICENDILREFPDPNT
jgi:hypothetical protein